MKLTRRKFFLAAAAAGIAAPVVAVLSSRRSAVMARSDLELWAGGATWFDNQNALMLRPREMHWFTFHRKWAIEDTAFAPKT